MKILAGCLPVCILLLSNLVPHLFCSLLFLTVWYYNLTATDLLIERPPIIDLQAARDKEMADHESSSIVIFAILGSITLLSLFFLGANIHARHRLNAGKPPLWYHKFCVKKTKPNDMHLGSLWTRRNPSCPPMPPMPPVWRPYFHGHNTELPAQIHVRRVYRMRPYPSGYHRAPLVAFCGVPLADLAAPTLADSITPRQGQVQFAPPPPYQEAINAGPACPVPTTRPRPRSSSLPGMQPTRSRG